ncbi:hypothetical protein MCOR02_007817 [Pyricularia oryzae]|nr:hypothetical protein MCOR02_007817 [Pyricularia oryzae]KAI6497754.1 hypothetical protein MCOR13_006704 [Pyricularia oryzae]KAI6604054.1 hypothetical protein MCOR04_001609 [Pyricularia oryzae]KAI6641642.1 hypothetical protein MCOR14_002856 [Pyricularia oryzae]
MPSSTAAVFTVSLLATLAAASPLAEQQPAARLNPRAMARPKFGNVPYGQQLKSCVEPNMIALTFDDGPGQYTAHVLDLLEKAGNLKATFFLNGKNGQNGMENSGLSSVLKRMVNAGHQLASHSYSHKNFDEISADEQEQELLLNEDAFARLIGMVPTYFRPPFTACGATCLATAGRLAYHVTDYDLDTKDYEGNLQASKNKFQEGMSQSPKSWVALAHDIHELTANSITPFMIDTAKSKGYKFVTMGECLGDPRENWYRDPSTGRAVAALGSSNNVKPPALVSSESSSTTASSTTATATSTSVSKPTSTPTPVRAGNSTTSNASSTRSAGSPASTSAAAFKEGAADRVGFGGLFASLIWGATAFALLM